MLRISLCELPKSLNKIQKIFDNKLKNLQVSIDLFDDLEMLFHSGKNYNLYFIRKNKRELNEQKLLSYIEGNDDKTFKKGDYHFVIYIDDPISDLECDSVCDFIKRHFEYDSIPLSIEFLTDRGLKSIPINNIIYFEYLERKIKIKTHESEYFCSGTLQNILALVEDYYFLSPHKSYIVSLRHITSIKGYEITMRDNSIIPLSQKKSKIFRGKYRQYTADRSLKITKSIY